MEIGKVPENILKRSVFKKLTVKRPEVLVHSGVGEDCTAMDVGGHAIVLSTDPITGTADHIGRLAFHITANDIASSGAETGGDDGDHYPAGEQHRRRSEKDHAGTQ